MIPNFMPPYSSVLSVITIAMFTATAATAQVPVEDSPYILPKVGAVFDVDREIFGQPEQSIYTVVATGPDFVIYYEGQVQLGKKLDQERLTVEFSGIYPESCSAKLPDTENRSALKSLWPLKLGRQTDFSVGKTKATYIVQPQTILIHKNRRIPVHWVKGRLNENGFKSKVSIALKPGYALPMAAKWGQAITVHRYEAGADPDISVQEVDGKYKILGNVRLKDLDRCKDLFE